MKNRDQVKKRNQVKNKVQVKKRTHVKNRAHVKNTSRLKARLSAVRYFRALSSTFLHLRRNHFTENLFAAEIKSLQRKKWAGSKHQLPVRRNKRDYIGYVYFSDVQRGLNECRYDF